MRPSTVVVTGLAVSAFVLAACSGDDSAVPAADTPTTTALASATPEATTEHPIDPSVSAVDPSSTVPPDGVEPAETEPVGEPATTFAVSPVPDTGVPGLDSDDAFCAAWSRFGGSWQVLQVAANFAPDPTIVPSLEVVAAPVVQEAYDAIFAAWPDALAAERDDVADGFFGPLERRSEAALDALVDAGADADDLTTIAAAWEAALAARRPEDPVVSPVLPDDVWALVEAAATDFDGRFVGLVDDPSMRVAVETPATDNYLATECPDQGALTGGEVGETVGS